MGLWWRRRRLAIRLRSLAPQTIIGVSEGVVNQLAHEYRFPTRKLRAIPNGIPVERYYPDAAVRATIRSEWGIPPGAFLFGTVARLSMWVKGHDIAIDLLSRLRTEKPELEFWFVLVGEGRDRERLKQMAQAAGIADRVVFAGYTDRPWEAHCAIDVFLMPSRLEGIGLSLIESMATECCPVAMAVGGVTDVIVDPSMGWTVPPGDTEAFYAAMSQALEASPDERQAMGKRARAHVLAHFRAEEQFPKVADAVIGDQTR